MGQITVTSTLSHRPRGRFQYVAALERDFSDAVFSPPVTVNDNYLTATGTIQVDQPGWYYVTTAEDGRINKLGYGRKWVFPRFTPWSFGFLFGSCADNDSAAPTWASMTRRVLLGTACLFIHLGDANYRNNDALTEAPFVAQMQSTLRSAPMRTFFSLLGVHLVHDDHDGAGGGGDTDMTSPGWAASQSALRLLQPAPFAQESGATYQSWTVGRVRFIVTDLRSERSPNQQVDDADKVMMSPTQLAWFKTICLEAKAAGQVIVWGSNYPWVGAKTLTGGEHWGYYSTYAQMIADWLVANGLQKSIFIVSGDGHFLAWDDGTSVNNRGGFYTMNGAPFDRPGNVKAGDYKSGIITIQGAPCRQYGFVAVNDNGSDAGVSLRAQGIRVSADGTDTVMIDETFELLFAA